MSRRYHLPPGSQARFNAGRPTDADMIRLQRARDDVRSEYRIVWIFIILGTVLTAGLGIVITGPLAVMLLVKQSRDNKQIAQMTHIGNTAARARAGENRLRAYRNL